MYYLEGVYKNYKQCADLIDWKNMSINDLFFGYIKNEHTNLKEPYFAAIVCKTWGYAGRIYSQCNRHVTFDDCHDCIIDAIRYVLDKRVWEDPNNSLYGDNSAPDKAIHIAIKRQRSLMLAKLNAYRRRSNFNAVSIDGMHEAYKDSADGLLFELETSEDNNLKFFIYDYFKEGDYISGLFLDLICYNNYTKYKTSKIIQLLKEITLDDFDYYRDTYEISRDQFIKTLIKIRDTSDSLLRINLKRLLYTLGTGGLFNA